MEAEKFRNLTAAELEHQQRELHDQLFRMKFQLKTGQAESLNKIRGLRKDVARVHTVIREKQLGIVHRHAATSAATTEVELTAEKPAKGKRTTKSKSRTKTKAKAKAKTRKR